MMCDYVQIFVEREREGESLCVSFFDLLFWIRIFRYVQSVPSL